MAGGYVNTGSVRGARGTSTIPTTPGPGRTPARARSRTARLYITQPGLSLAIARLERELQVRLFTRTRSNVELTDAGTDLLDRARGLLAGLDEAVTRARMAGRGEAGLVRVGVALLAEPIVAQALTAFQEKHKAVVLDRSAMVSERLLAHLAEGHLHAAVIHQVPALAAAETVAWEPLRRGRLAVVASPASELALRETVTLSELSGQTFLVNPRSLAPGAFEGLKLMCREYGGFDPRILESAAASTAVLDTDWRPIQDGTGIAVIAEATARAVRPAMSRSCPSSHRPSTPSPSPGGVMSALRRPAGSSATFAPTATSTAGRQPRIRAQPQSPRTAASNPGPAAHQHDSRGHWQDRRESQH